VLQFAVKLVAVTLVAFSACGAAGVGVGVAVGVPGGVIVGVGDTGVGVAVGVAGVVAFF